MTPRRVVTDIAVSGLIAMTLVACAARDEGVTARADSAAASSPAVETAGAKATVIAFEHEIGPCHGRCPTYRVEILADGRARFEGRAGVADSGVHEGQIDRAGIEQLAQRFTAAGFFAVDTLITATRPACGAYVADLQESTISATIDGRVHRVRFDRGCRGRPFVLDTLASLVDSVAGALPRISRSGDTK